MKQRTEIAIFILSLVLCFFSGSAVAESAKLAQVIRFTDYETGSEEDWLLGKGFQFKEDARRRNLIDLEVNDDESLTIEAKRRAFGFVDNETVNVTEFTFVEIDWGINMTRKGNTSEA